jgi:hypothetical protein
MKTTLSVYQIADLLKRDESAGWSYNGSKALAEYLDENIPEDEEFDRVAIRCEYSEYTSALEATEDYDYESDDSLDEDVAEKAALEWFKDNTTVIEFTGGIIVVNF